MGTALTETSLLAISKCALEEIIGPLEEACKMSIYSKYLRSIPLLEHLEHGEIDRCVRHLKFEMFGKGDTIKSRGGKLYLIGEGRALMTMQDEGDNDQTDTSQKKEMTRESTLVKLDKGDYFGDLFRESDDKEQENGSTQQGEAATDNMDENLIIAETNMECFTLLKSDVERVIGGNLRPPSELNTDPAAEAENESRITRLKKKWSRKSSNLDTIKMKKSKTNRDVSNLSKLKKHRILGVG